MGTQIFFIFLRENNIFWKKKTIWEAFKKNFEVKKVPNQGKGWYGPVKKKTEREKFSDGGEGG